ncbi:MAG: hypothetical protein SOR89_05265 [Ndongobacter sp.]|nr:hypothetical protein [Ndongobacter sp.]
MKQILPVILGSDFNAYNVARSFHEAYGVTSATAGKGILVQVKHSKIVEPNIVPNFDDDELFVKYMLEFAQKNRDKTLILLSAGENYVNKIFRTYDALKEAYIIPYTDGKQGLLLGEKENAYMLFEKYGIDYPRYILSDTKYTQMTEIPYDFPVVVKPTQSTYYFEMSFPGKEKAYIVKGMDELNAVLKRVYDAGYEYPMFIQEFVHGDIQDEYVLNTYVDRKGNVTLHSMGRIVIDDPNPDLRGNYFAIEDVKVDDEVRALFDRVDHFLTEIGYRGLANFDLKKDARTGRFMCFEINLRQGRSSYFSTLSGANFAKAIVNDYILDRVEYLASDREFLWYVTDYALIRDVLSVTDPETLARLDRKAVKGGTLEYPFDNSLLRKRLLSKYFSEFRKRTKSFS